MSVPTLVSTLQALSRCRELPEIMSVLAPSVRHLTGADGVTVVLRDHDLCYYAEEDAISPLWKGRRFPMRSCISGWCMLNREQVVIPDIYEDDRIPHDAYRPTFVKSLAMTPIRSTDPIGAIGAYWADHHVATPEELEVLQALGDTTSVAMANVELIDALRDAGRRKDEFLAVLAHELRNPLAPIWHATHLLHLEAGSSPVADRAHTAVERQMRHMSRLIDDLLDSSRLTRGALTLHPEPLDLATLVEEIAEDWRSRLDEAGLALVVEVRDRPVSVEVDRVRVTQIVGNLLHNAQKFSDAGGRVTLRVEVEVDGFAVVEVVDTGRGIDPEDLAHVFETLSQGHQSLARTSGGLGLGLPIARGLAELHGGSLRVADHGPEPGARFTLRLPLASAAHLQVVEGPAEGEPAVRTTGGPSVLIVEDNEDSADLMRIYLEHHGFETRVAGNGHDAVALATANPPQIVLCDIGVPGLDGYAIAAALRAEPLTKGATLIAVTGYGSPDDRRRALEAGFDDHVVKPVDLPDILELVRLSWAS